MAKMKVKSGIGITRVGEKRHFVLLDVENLAGSASPSAADLGSVELRLQNAMADFDEALCVVACSHHAAETVAFAFPRGLRRWRSGEDGADLALIEEMGDLRVMKRFGKVTVCSGDGIFAGPLAALAEAGIETEVVSRSGSLSSALRLSAQHVVELPDDTHTPPVSPTTEFGKAS